MQSTFGKRCKQWLTPLSGTQKVVLNRKHLHQAHVFTLLLRISIHSNRESSDVAVARISEKVEQSDNFVYMR